MEIYGLSQLCEKAIVLTEEVIRLTRENQELAASGTGAWLPISMAPKDQEVIGLYWGAPDFHGPIGVCRWSKWGWWGCGDHCPTHWLPLPEPPEAK